MPSSVDTALWKIPVDELQPSTVQALPSSTLCVNFPDTEKLSTRPVPPVPTAPPLMATVLLSVILKYAIVLLRAVIALRLKV